MSQLAPQSQMQPVGHNSYVPDMKYAYDVVHRTGRFVSTIKVPDLETIPHTLMGGSAVCPMPWGACVTATAAGTVHGVDMYGQWIEEDITAGGTSTKAFAAVSLANAPAGLAWTNQYGLPYKYLADSDDTPTDVTITPPADGEDTRGTWTYAGTYTDTGHATVTIGYLADVGNLMGDPYGEEHVVNSMSVSVSGTISTTGLITIIPIPSVEGMSTGVTITFPDGHTVRAVMGAGSPLTHQLSPIWMSQYADVIDDAALDRLVAVAFDAPELVNMYLPLTGSISSAFDPMDEPDPEPEPDDDDVTPSPSEWSTLSTHSALDQWASDNADRLSEPLPDAWSTWTIAGKKAWLDAHVEPSE